MLNDFRQALQRPSVWLYTTWVQFLILYRRTVLGPLWVVLAPLAFIILLGFLFSAISQSEPSVFIPHMTVGYIVWGFISEIMGGASRLYVRSKGALLSGAVNHVVLHLRLIARATIKLLHQVIIIVGVCVVFGVVPSRNALFLLPAFLLLLVHAYWVSVVFSLAGARWRDIPETTDIIMRVAFLATPIIWMPLEGGRGSIIGSYLVANPFYHVLEPMRASILNTAFPYLSMLISCVIAAVGIFCAKKLYDRFQKDVILWV